VGPGETITIADLPGLLEGAHRGVGLGDRFLRHIERTHLILHLVDVSPEALRPPEEAYRVVREELSAYSDALAARPEIVVANKIDRTGARAGVKRLAMACGGEVAAISAEGGRGLESLVRRLKVLRDG
jgi:GTP-binding protein